jgi:hypothetical protein
MTFNSKRKHIRIGNWEKHKEKLAVKTLHKQEFKKIIGNSKKLKKKSKNFLEFLLQENNRQFKEIKKKARIGEEGESIKKYFFVFKTIW